MGNVVKIEDVQNVIVNLRGQTVILDCDVAGIYGVETKRVNEAVKNNPDKFPPDYMFEVSDEEFDVLRSKFSTAKFSKTRTLPKAFSENEKQGLMQRSGELIAEVLDNDLQTTDTETSVEINFAVLKFKHTIKKADKTAKS